MPYRVYHLALGIAGLLAVFTLLLVGANLLRASRSGPAWKQRLVSAGLVLLGAMGFGSGIPGCTKKGTTPDTDTPTVNASGNNKPDKPDPATPKLTPWKQINAVEAEAEAIAAGKKGQYPFDRAGKNQLLAALTRAGALIDDLHGDGELNAGEAGLWKRDLQLLSRKVNRFRATERKTASCYKPMMVPDEGKISLGRIRARLPLLEKLASANKLHPKVSRKVLARIEADLFKIPKPPSEEDKKLVGRAYELVAQVKAKLGEPASPAKPGTVGEWQVVKEAWSFIAPLAAASSKSTTTQRKEADEKMKGALAALDRMVKAGKLSPTEAALLTAESERLKGEMYRSPPADRQIKCYRRAFVSRAEVSLKRINKRLPLLRKLVAAKKLNPKVLDRVLPTLERDLLTLSTPKEVKRMRGELKGQATAAARRAKSMLAKLRTLAQAQTKK